jgi:hypothetical protein
MTEAELVIIANERSYTVEGGFYKNGRRALMLNNADWDEVRIATMNAVEYREHALVDFATKLDEKAEDIVFIKTHAENAGIADALRRAGLIIRTGTAAPLKTMTGVEICFITSKAKKELPWENREPRKPK